MGQLTEREIFDCLTENFRLAAQHAEDLARVPKGGPVYIQFREELRLIEGACRQAAQWREDARWLPMGMKVNDLLQRCGDWLRGVRNKDGTYTAIPADKKHPLFLLTAEALRDCQRQVERLRDQKTGRVGMILPANLAGARAHARKVQNSRLILPTTMAVGHA